MATPGTTRRSNKMPELPEVTTVIGLLKKEVIGKTIVDIDIFYKKAINEGDTETFIKEVKGRTIEDILRHGKFILFKLNDDLFMVSHLRMEGKYFFKNDKRIKEKHDIVTFTFTDGTTLTYNDQRKFGIILLRTKEELYSTLPLSKLGKEPWDINVDEYYKKLSKKNAPLKEALLDQTIMCGLGNIYADEVLFLSKLHPLKNAKTITKDQAETLLLNSRKVLEKAIELGGSTIRSYHPEEGIDGRFQILLKVYGRHNEPCVTCGTPLKKIKVNGRGTTYCPVCQEDKEHPLWIGVTGPVAAGKSTVTKYFENHGFYALSSDEIVHELYEKQEVIKLLKEAFGSEFITDNKIDRTKLFNLLKNDEKKHQAINDLIHPLVVNEILKRLENKGRAVIEVPLLLSTPLRELTGLNIFVKASDETIINRLKKRGKDASFLSFYPKYPNSIIKKYCPIIIDNNGTEKELESKLDEIYQKLD